MTEIIDFLLTRRSVTARNMIEPGPGNDQLHMILRAAHRVPDHGKLGPWRFVILKGDARAEFGEILGAAYRKENPDAFDELIEVEKERFQRAPVVVVVTSRITPGHKIPEWEQTLSSGAACMNMLNAAHALGFAAQWITEWPAYNDDVAHALGVGEHERIAGFVYIGTAAQPPEERRRPDIGDIVTEWKGPA
jgi:nitroreductase